MVCARNSRIFRILRFRANANQRTIKTSLASGLLRCLEKIPKLVSGISGCKHSSALSSGSMSISDTYSCPCRYICKTNKYLSHNNQGTLRALVQWLSPCAISICLLVIPHIYITRISCFITVKRCVRTIQSVDLLKNSVRTIQKFIFTKKECAPDITCSVRTIQSVYLLKQCTHDTKCIFTKIVYARYKVQIY